MRSTLARVAAAALLIGSTATALPAAPQKSIHYTLNTTLPDTKFTNVPLSDVFDYLRDVGGANIHVDWKALESVNITKDTTINVHLHDVTMRKVLTTVLSEAGDGNLLTYYVDDNVLEITTRAVADKQLLTKIYPVDDLLVDIPDVTQQDLNFGNVAQNQNQSVTLGQGGTGGSQMSQSSGGIFSNTSGGGGGGGSGDNSTVKKADRAQQLVKLIEDIIQPDIWRDNGGPASIRYFQGNLIVTAPRSVHEAIGGAID